MREAARLLINLVLYLHQKSALLDDIAEPSAGRRGLPYPSCPATNARYAPISRSGNKAIPAYNINGIGEQDDAVRSAVHYRFSDDWHASYVAGWSEFDNDSVLPTTPTFFFLQHNRATAVSHEIDLSYDTQRLHGIFGGYYDAFRLTGGLRYSFDREGNDNWGQRQAPDVVVQWRV